jgi:glyoxylase-like metal-dependent hydrolase (beta-lactamase superfamily II)
VIRRSPRSRPRSRSGISPASSSRRRRSCSTIGWEGTFAQWTAALDEIAALDPAVVVPGHGPLCGVEGPREMRAYLAYVRAESRVHFDAGRPSLEAAKRIDLGPYAGWTEPERLFFNVERAYREFRGLPYDAPIDVMATFRGMHELRGHLGAHRH